MDFLFDIGSVIVGVDFIPALKRISSLEGDLLEERIAEVLERKDEMEAGRLPVNDYFPWVRDRLEHTGSKEEFYNAWTDIFSANEPMWQSIEKLAAQGHRLLLFSNINQPHQGYLLAHYPVFKHFAGGVFSHQTGHIKPEAEIYDFAIKTYNLQPEATAYVDDLSANIAAGKKAGFLCHQYVMDRHEDFCDWLATL